MQQGPALVALFTAHRLSAAGTTYRLSAAGRTYRYFVSPAEYRAKAKDYRDWHFGKEEASPDC